MDFSDDKNFGTKKLKDMLDYLEHEELLKLRADIAKGGYHLLELVKGKLKERELKHKSFCSFCGNEIDKNNVNTYTLVFGPYDFRKKATFCAMDCMDSFLAKLKAQKAKFSSLPKKSKKTDD